MYFRAGESSVSKQNKAHESLCLPLTFTPAQLGRVDIEHTFKPFNVPAMEGFNLVKNLCAGCITPSRLRWSGNVCWRKTLETETCTTGALCWIR
jgi:hypothetical protein